MSRLDYSKWDHIEISDDEDDTHPNIDTPSLFRWRHQARIDRMDEFNKKREEVHMIRTEHQKKMDEINKKIKMAEAGDVADELEKLKLEAAALEKQEKQWKEKEAELEREEKLAPLNIDTICKEGKSRTIINKCKVEKTQESDDDKAEKLQKFVEEKKELIEKFGMMKKYDDSCNFLLEHRDLVCEETANHLVLWCINLQLEEKKLLMQHVAHQTIVMQFILQLAESLKINPKDCVKAFFTRISVADKQYMAAFNEELEAFKGRVCARAEVRIQEAIKAAEEEEKQERLGPGGLDPQEVFESLPEEMQQCFESRDISSLQAIIASMEHEQAKYHMKRCVDSGLWVPNAADYDVQQGEDETYEDVSGGIDAVD